VTHDKYGPVIVHALQLLSQSLDSTKCTAISVEPANLTTRPEVNYTD
jgi:hypothetical protein